MERAFLVNILAELNFLNVTLNLVLDFKVNVYQILSWPEPSFWC